MGHVQVQTATDSREDARRLGRALVEERLAACVQVVGPIDSTFWWEGKVQVEEEYLCLAKTTIERVDALTARLRELHTYDLPEITVLPITGGLAAYLDWIDEETGQAAKS